ncbi:unnamed protein product [Cuscuta europaea]|uniref:Reverse transcriptase domain-containing protein n=1 Tax=Cuscuta europaea TaxID=41803 RepID=A0A9P0ZHB7_CUSEU|nr:unnamed protein product [Cuscuta europaea]
MSPSLFLHCMEYLSRILCILTSSQDFNFHPKCSQLKISHVIFVDDLMLFSMGDLVSIQTILKFLKDFRMTSGLSINVAKSNIFLAGVTGLDKETILGLVGYLVGQFPVKYLSISLARMRVSIAQYSPLLEKIEKFTNKWKTKCISYAGD